MDNNRQTNLTDLLSIWREVPTKADFDKAAERHQNNATALRAAGFLTKESRIIVDNAMQALYENHPELQGASNGDASDLGARFRGDINSYVKAVADSLAGGDPNIIVNNVKEISKLGSLPNQPVEVLGYIKSSGGLTGEDAQIANDYIDLAIKALE